MLAQNFNKARDISDAEFEAAVKLLGMLERGELKNHYCLQQIDGTRRYNPQIPNGFDMQCAGLRTDCGTVACIGGWMAILMDRDMATYVYSISPESSLWKLFWSCTDNALSTEKAATAVRNYLTFGNPRWDEVLRLDD
jgi:hypothetical protein